MEKGWPLAILSNLSDGVLALDQSGRIFFANPAAVTILGETSDYLLGRSARDILGSTEPAGGAQQALCPLCETMKDGQTRHVTGGIFMGSKRQLFVDLTVSPMHMGADVRKSGFFLTFRDVTDKGLDIELRALKSMVLDGITTGRPLNELMTLIATAVDQQLPQAQTTILLARGGKLSVAAAPGLPQTFVPMLDGAIIGEGGGPWTASAHQKAKVIVEDIATDPQWRDLAQSLQAHGFAACWSTPILDADGTVVAVISSFRQKSGGPSARNQELIDRVSNYARIAIERTNQNEALRASEEHFRSIYDLIPVLIWEEDWCDVRALLFELKDQGITDLQTYVADRPDFVDRAIKSVRVLNVNKSGARIFGAQTAEDLLAAADQIIDAPESILLFRRALMAYLAGERELVSESVRSDINGRQLNLYVKMLIPDIASSDTRVVLTEMDVTDLTLANERFQVVVNATSDVVWDFEVASEKVWCSAGLKTWFGLDPNDFASGKTVWSDHLHPEERDFVVAQQKAILTSNETSWKTEYRFRRHDGTYADVRDHGTILRDRNGNATRMIGSMVDVTRQKRIEEQLRQSQKLEAVGQLTGGVAHDFNNLLTVILGNAEILEEELADRPHLRRLARMALDAAGRGAELTNRLLAFSRKQALQPKVIDVAQLVQGLHGLLRRTLPASIEIEILCAYKLWKSEIDATQLETALLNLALNSRDAMPDGGHLQIQVANATLDDDFPARDADVRAGQYVEVTVKDTGHGMPTDVVSRIFEPFFTTKEVGKGSGLGLSMVYGFVKQSGGHIQVHSEPGHGTTFKLCFPRAPASSDKETPPEPLAGRIIGGQETILVVEDDDLVRENVIAQLVGLGYSILSAPDGSSALDFLRKNSDIALLFTDVVMPGGIDGRALAEQARLINADLKILFTSGYTENTMVHNGRLDKGIDLLGKPYRRDQLARRIREALESDQKQAF